ncbi:MAG: polyribonucleotide nucleotidyltransferase, partial [Sphingomonadales bacterium]
VLEIDPRGKVRLSMRVVDQETGAELEDTRPAREPREGGDRPRGDRPARDGDRRRDGGGGRDRGPRREGGGDRGPRGGGEGRGDRGPRPERSEAKDDGGDIGLPAFLTGDKD